MNCFNGVCSLFVIAYLRHSFQGLITTTNVLTLTLSKIPLFYKRFLSSVIQQMWRPLLSRFVYSCWFSFTVLHACTFYEYSYFEKGCRKKSARDIPKGNMDPDTVAVEPTFVAFL